jgi:glycosyltransferase involved in cell wall biosynthesis
VDRTSSRRTLFRVSSRASLARVTASHDIRALRIGFDASVIFSSLGGTGVYASQLLRALFESRPDWTFFPYVRSPEEARELNERWSAANAHPTVVAGSPNTWRVQTRLPAQLRHDRIDAYHSFGYFLPLAWRGPKIVTIHDLNIYVHWRSWMRPNKVLNWADMAVQTPLAMRAASSIITDSQFSKSSISKLMRVAPEKVVVIPLAPDPFFDSPPTKEEVAEARDLTSGAPFLLSVGFLSPVKNLGMLIKSFAASGLPGGGTFLVLAGSDQEGHADDLRATAMACGVSGQVLLPGFVSRELLRALYHTCLAVVLPSYAEGFGLPAVEAMACGAPVLAANRQSLPEVVGDAGLLFEPDDVDSLASLLKRLAGDSGLRQELARKALARRDLFSWRAAAESTAAVYESAVRNLGRAR